MKKILFILIILSFLLPTGAFSNPITGISNYNVGGDPHDMDGMEITVELVNGTTETSTWDNNIASGTGWSLSYSGNYTGHTYPGPALNWELLVTPGSSTGGIKNITIDAYANQEVFFDIVYSSEETIGSKVGLWGPTYYRTYASSGVVAAGATYIPTSETFGQAFFFDFKNPIFVQGQSAPALQDLYEILYIDFLFDGSGNALAGGAAMTTKFNLAVDTDYVDGSVPEPATILLFGLGLLGMSAVSRRKS